MDRYWLEGWKDAHEGNHDCPYCSDTEEYTEWLEGWEAAGGEDAAGPEKF